MLNNEINLMPIIYNVLFLITFLLLITGSVVLYRFFYKRHLNRKLNGEPSRFTLIDPLNFVLIILMTIVMIINVMGYRKITDLEDDISNLHGRNNDLMQRLNRVHTTLFSTYDKLEEMEQDAKWIQNSSYSFIDVTEDGDRIITKVNFDFKEVGTDQMIYLIVTDKEDASDTMKIEATEVNFKYEVSLELEWNHAYKLEVVAEDGTTLKKDTLFDIDVSDEFDNSNMLDGIGGHNENGTFILTDVAIHYYHGGIDALQMKSIKLETTTNDETTMYDITDLVMMSNSSTSLNIKVIFDDLDDIDLDINSVDTFQFIITDQSGNEYKSHIGASEVLER